MPPTLPSTNADRLMDQSVPKEHAPQLKAMLRVKKVPAGVAAFVAPQVQLFTELLSRRSMVVVTVAVGPPCEKRICTRFNLFPLPSPRSTSSGPMGTEQRTPTPPAAPS